MYYECMFIALGIQRVIRMGHIVMCCFSCSIILSNIISKTARFLEKKFTEHKMSFFIFDTNCVRNISHSKNNPARHCHKRILVFMYSTGYSHQISMKLEFSPQILGKYSNIKTDQNPSTGS